jgi:hypothetical protein
MPPVPLSPVSVYRPVASGPNSGAAIDDVLEQLATVGPLPVKGNYQHTHPPTGYHKRLPRGFEDTAELFRLREWWDVPDFQSFISALLLGFPICYGVRWGRFGGHAILATEAVYDERQGWGCEFLNSWGYDWGDHGFGRMFERQISYGIDVYGAWAARVPTAA